MNDSITIFLHRLIGRGAVVVPHLFLCGALLAMAGCATLPKSLPVEEGVAEQVRQEFTVMLRDQQHCPSALDADVSVTVDNLMWSGTLTGYLRAMAPAYLRFEGVNPLGLTEAIFAVDGKNFTYLSVRDQQVYSGPLSADLLSRYTPDGLATAMNYSWLLGRIPPGQVGIGEVGLDENGQEYWLDLDYAGNDQRSRILFNPAAHLIKRHLVLSMREAIDADLVYEYPLSTTPAGSEQSTHPTKPEENGPPSPALTVGCLLPERITMKSPGNGFLGLGFNKRYPTPKLDSAPFRITPPAEYQRNVVQ